MKVKILNKEHNIDLESMGLTQDQIIILSVTGSNMYGTNTPDSDKDYIGVYMPTPEQILLNNFPNQVSLPKDSGIDIQIWSIYYFMKLLYNGETLSIDLLHSPLKYWVIYKDYIWLPLVKNKHLFYTKKMNSFVSYARTQAAKYGVKGDRIKDIKNVIAFLKTVVDTAGPEVRLATVWNELPSGKYILWDGEPKIRMYEVCNRKFQETVKISYILGKLEKTLTQYGKRAKIAENNKGIDWKAFSHAIRAAEQVYWIFKYGGYSYPLKNNDFIKKVKLGEIDFKMTQAVLEDYMTEIEKMMETTLLPEKVDKEIWNQWLIKIIGKHVS